MLDFRSIDYDRDYKFTIAVSFMNLSKSLYGAFCDSIVVRWTLDKRRLFDDRNYWAGTAQELLTELEDHHHCSERTKNRRDWPKTPEALGKALRRIAPNLRQGGIDVRFDRGSGKRRRRLIVLEKLDILLSDLSEPSGDTRNKGASNVVSDRLDGSDSNIPPYSCESPCHSRNEARTHD